MCISAISFSWIEAPYDWAMYAQFPPALPRMPSWWPLNMTWGGLPSSVPVGYIGYFCLPAVIGAALGRRLDRTVRMAPGRSRYLTVGPRRRLLLGAVFNAGLGARLGVFYYAYVIPGSACSRGPCTSTPSTTPSRWASR